MRAAAEPSAGASACLALISAPEPGAAVTRPSLFSRPPQAELATHNADGKAIRLSDPLGLLTTLTPKAAGAAPRSASRADSGNRRVKRLSPLSPPPLSVAGYCERFLRRRGVEISLGAANVRACSPPAAPSHGQPGAGVRASCAARLCPLARAGGPRRGPAWPGRGVQVLRREGAERRVLGRGDRGREDAAGVRCQPAAALPATGENRASGPTITQRAALLSALRSGTSSGTPACASAARATCSFSATWQRRALTSGSRPLPTGARRRSAPPRAPAPRGSRVPATARITRTPLFALTQGSGVRGRSDPRDVAQGGGVGGRPLPSLHAASQGASLRALRCAGAAPHLFSRCAAVAPPLMSQQSAACCALPAPPPPRSS